MIVQVGHPQSGRQIVGSQIFLVTEIIPDNSRLDDFEEALVDHIIRAQANKPPMSWTIHSALDGRLFYFMGIRNYGELDEYYSKSAFLFQPSELDTIKKFNESIVSSKQYILRIHDDLSYLPENPEVIEKPVTVWDWLYCKSGSRKEMEDLFREFRTLAGKVNHPRTFRVFQGDFGIDGNLFIAAYSGKDLGELWSDRQQLMDAIGEKADKIETQIMTHLLSREQTVLYLRPDMMTRIRDGK